MSTGKKYSRVRKIFKILYQNFLFLWVKDNMFVCLWKVDAGIPVFVSIYLQFSVTFFIIQIDSPTPSAIPKWINQLFFIVTEPEPEVHSDLDSVNF